MARGWRSIGSWDGNGGGALESSVVLILWAAFLSMCLLLAVLASCADGATRDKTQTINNYTATATGCGAGCGGACGG